MTKFEEQYRDFLITNQGLDSGYYVHTPQGMVWFRFVSDAKSYVDFVSAR